MTTETKNEWDRAREIQARAKELADDASRHGEHPIGKAARRIEREFISGGDHTLLGADAPTEYGTPAQRFERLVADIGRLREDCEGVGWSRTQEREDNGTQDNGLSVGELTQTLRRIERHALREAV